jgi:hypothetical protein
MPTKQPVQGRPSKAHKRKLKRIYYPLFGLLIALGMSVMYLVLNDEPIPFVTSEQGIAPDILSGVGREGLGGDPILNRMKNRISEPVTIRDFTVPQVIGIINDVLMQEGRRQRKNWYPSARLFAEEKESWGVRVTGYLIRAKQSGVESGNGYIDSLRDYHLWIGDRPMAERRTTMVAEITPRWKIVHPEWHLRMFKRLAEQRAKVRVTGWLLWDQEHGSEVEKSRGTSWEVHPVTKFEVWSDSTWIELKALPEKDSIPVLPT